MQNIEELSRLEREFEDLQNLIKQQFGSLQELNSIQAELYSLKHAQEYSQVESQNTTEIVNRVESSQRRLSENIDRLESRIQNLNNQLSQFNQEFTQKLEKIASQSPSQVPIKTEIAELEARLGLQFKEGIEHLEISSATFSRHFEDLEIRFNRINRLIKEVNEKSKISLISMAFVSVLGCLAILFVIPYVLLNQ